MAQTPLQRATKSPEQILAELDELLKRNTGQGLYTATDATSNLPMYIPGKVSNPLGIEQSASSQFALRDRELPVYPEVPDMEVPRGRVLGETSNAPISIQDFFNQLSGAANTPQLPSTEELDKRYQQTGQKYAIASLSNGMVRYNDGTEGVFEGRPQPIASLRDGTVLWSDGFTRASQGLQQGEQGLSQFLFGQNQPVTQQFGNINPIEPTPGNVNLGTDFRTRDLQNRNIFLPMEAEVVEVLYDDGTRFGDVSGHQGYGNSVLLRLPTGEMLRLSHLSDMGDFQVGQQLAPGALIGTPGTTGNTTGEHLDVEYYDRSGNISDPRNFITNAQQMSQIVGESPYKEQAQPTQQPQPQQDQENYYPGKTINEGIVEPATKKAQQIAQVPKRAGQVLGAASEPLSPQRQGLGQIINEGGKVMGLPEMYAGEVASGEIDPGLAVRKNIEEKEPTGKTIDFGFSEFSTGDTEGALNIFSDTTGRIARRLSRLPGQTADAIANRVVPQALAYSPLDATNQFKESLGDNLKYIGNSVKNKFNQEVGEGKNSANQALQAAGQGISRLKNEFKPLSNIFSKGSNKPQRAIGDVSPNPETGSLMDSAASLLDRTKNDVRDTFFKSGLANDYQNFLKPNAEQLAGGALTLDLFNDEFYQDPNNIQKVFGNSSLAKPAQSRYDTYAEEQRRLQAERDAEQRQNDASLDDYLRQGKTAAQYYAETGRQSEADRAGGADKAAARSQMTVQQAQKSQAQGNPGATSVTMPGGRVVTAPKGQRVYVDASGQPQLTKDTSVTIGGVQSNFNTPTSQPSAQLNPAVLSKPKNNIFSNFSSLFNIYRR